MEDGCWILPTNFCRKSIVATANASGNVATHMKDYVSIIFGQILKNHFLKEGDQP